MNEYTKRPGVLSLLAGVGICLTLAGVSVCTRLGKEFAAERAAKGTSLLQVVTRASAAASSTLPTLVGQCATTTVASVGVRLADGETGQPIPGSGSQIFYANGGLQVSYDMLKGIDDSLKGDEVKMCLVSVPEHCPPGDDRGKVYAATNLRTGESWQASDAEHECGGA